VIEKNLFLLLMSSLEMNYIDIVFHCMLV